jgi:hypothetical protein
MPIAVIDLKRTAYALGLLYYNLDLSRLPSVSA